MKIRGADYRSTPLKLLQRMAELQGAELTLCPLFFNERLIFRGAYGADAAAQVTRLLKTLSEPVFMPVT
ncbi:MAG TPA: hypothetical protein VFI82_10920 [Terriglobales bacterium]|nr:hypothetical protein [Terriglobales bacterium]